MNNKKNNAHAHSCPGGHNNTCSIFTIVKKMASQEVLENMADIFKSFADPSRLKIINALMVSEMCVCEIAAMLGTTQPAVSHHLKTLRAVRLVKYRRDGKSIYYSLDDEHVHALFSLCHIHVSERK